MQVWLKKKKEKEKKRKEKYIFEHFPWSRHCPRQSLFYFLNLHTISIKELSPSSFSTGETEKLSNFLQGCKCYAVELVFGPKSLIPQSLRYLLHGYLSAFLSHVPCPKFCQAFLLVAYMTKIIGTLFISQIWVIIFHFQI